MFKYELHVSSNQNAKTVWLLNDICMFESRLCEIESNLNRSGLKCERFSWSRQFNVWLGVFVCSILNRWAIKTYANSNTAYHSIVIIKPIFFSLLTLLLLSVDASIFPMTLVLLFIAHSIFDFSVCCTDFITLI